MPGQGGEGVRGETDGFAVRFIVIELCPGIIDELRPDVLVVGIAGETLLLADLAVHIRRQLVVGLREDARALPTDLGRGRFAFGIEP